MSLTTSNRMVQSNSPFQFSYAKQKGNDDAFSAMLDDLLKNQGGGVDEDETASGQGVATDAADPKTTQQGEPGPQGARDLIDNLRKPALDKMVDQKQIAFERDHRGEGDDREKGVLKAEVSDLYDNDPEFQAAFDEARGNGLRVVFRFNADDNSATVVNNEILLVDIKSDADAKKELKKLFNKDSEYSAVEPGEGPSLEDVMADRTMSPTDYVDNMERLGVFSFSGPNGGKIRKDVIHMLEKSPFIRKMIEQSIEAYDGERKYNFSSIGEGGGTVSRPLDDFATSVNAGGAYDGVSTEDYDPETERNFGIMAHEMMHTFMEIPDQPVIDVAGEIFARDHYGDDREYSEVARITYDDDLKGTAWALNEDFDTDAFLEASFSGELNGVSHQEIFDRFGGASVAGGPKLRDAKAYDDKLNGLVESIRSDVDVKGRTTPYMEGDLADQYKALLDYNMASGKFDTWWEAADQTKKDLTDRLGNFGPEANVFQGYLDRHGGNEQLDNLAFAAWNDIMNPGNDLIRDAGQADELLNSIVSTLEKGIDVKGRSTPYMEGSLANDYKKLLEYNLRHGNFRSFEDLSDFTRDQLMDRLGNFPDQANVFAGYLKRHGGNKTLDGLAETVWTDVGLDPALGLGGPFGGFPF